ncbi:hypothetical protein [Ralstonia wenshanensis]|uniref:Uncharacterized protein n=1 Tax=Ralstonia wenshanensis TaxID=2842456 RepID=A0AAD2AX68_9RALS|nr:hypothetical protein [Ralstonia wenshanensis]CAJ0691751.1 hypothetical protein LMG18091_01499 [Ralstonia wenshanensis]
MIYLSSLQYRFRRASKEECRTLIKACHRVAPGGASTVDVHLRDWTWWIHEGDLRLPSNVVNDINLIVTGDVIVDGWYDDYLGGGLLAVFGSMRCRHVFSWYTLYVAGDLLVQGLNLQYHNDWIFECGGQVAARAFIGADKSCLFDLHRSDLEGYYYSLGFDAKSSLRPYRMLGLLEGEEDGCKVEDASPEGCEDEEQDEYDDFETPSSAKVIAHVKAAEAQGRSAFSTPEPAPATVWREALHPDTALARLVDLVSSHGWDVAMRPKLEPELQVLLADHADARVRWALATSPDVSEALLRQLANNPAHVVRAAVASHVRCPSDLQICFAKDAAADVRAAVVHAHGRGPAEWVTRMAGDPCTVVRRAVAVIPNLPPNVVAQLTSDADDVVRLRTMRIQSPLLDPMLARFVACTPKC